MGGGGEGGPRGIFLCRNLGGSMGSCCRSTIFIMRSFLPADSSLAPPIWFAGVYRTNVGSALFPPFTFLGFCAATAPSTNPASAFFVFSICAATSSSDGRSSDNSPISTRWRSGIRSLNDACTVRLSLCPRRAIWSYFTLPSASTCTVRALDFDVDDVVPFRPMSSGYCATRISGNAPPSPKSSTDRGRQPVRLP